MNFKGMLVQAGTQLQLAWSLSLLMEAHGQVSGQALHAVKQVSIKYTNN